MKKAIAWMARNHVAANLLMLFFVVGGIVMSHSIKQEIFPEISLDTIRVSVPYPGATPEEVEDGIILKIEENLTGVDGIKEIRSTASEGMGNVDVVVREGANADLVLQDVKNAVDRIITFPENAEKPIISKLLNRREVISVIVYGDLSPKALREQAEHVKNQLLELPEITQVDLGGVRPYEISVNVTEDTLRRYNLTLDEIARRIRQASVDLPGGRIKTRGEEILLRTNGKRYYGPGYGNIIILAKNDGTKLRLRDIAKVRDGFEDTDEFARFDEKPAAMIKVFRVGNQKPLDISREVKDFVARESATLPPSVKISTWNDTSEKLKSRINLLEKNALFGLILVFVVLGLFLEIRLALWVMLGIPVSFLGALFIMPGLDLSINMISLFAFIMALGIVVDDAIVIGENIFEHRKKGKTFLKAAIDGTIEVGIPVIFSVLTTVAAFVPLIFVSGIMGKFIKVIPLVVISILLVSLMESLFVLPAHLSFGSEIKETGRILGTIRSVRLRFSAWLENFIYGPYRSALKTCVEHRYSTIALGLCVLLLVVGVVKAGFIKFRFMPVVESDKITVSIEMPVGTPVSKTGQVERYIVEKGREAVAELDRTNPSNTSILKHIYAVIGGTIATGGPTGGTSSSASNIANIAMLLQPTEDRAISTTTVEKRWREKVGRITGVDSIKFKSNLVHMGANINVQLAHEDFKTLAAAAERLKKILAEYPGVTDIADNYSIGKREFKLRLTPQARMLGITEQDLGRQIRAAFYGAEALRFQRGRNEIKVMVRYPEKERTHIWDLMSMRIRTPDGGEIPLEQAARIIPGYGFSTIHRYDRKRVINVTANVDSKTANPEEILADLKAGPLARLKKDYPGLTYSMQGEAKEENESMNTMMRGFALALFAIYALLAIPFRSYTQPLIIMVAIPFGMVGAVLGHMIMGYDLSILSMFGIVALSGVVVNDSLLLIDKINSDRRDGKGMRESVIDAGIRRFRPILLTSLTTFFGLTPMIMETSIQAQFLIPMAISLGFGILFATGVTLLLIPSMYVVLEEVKSLIRKT